MRATIIAIATIFIMSGCTYESYNQREIVGQWYSESWTSDGAETGYRSWMAFEQDSTYRAIFNTNREMGTYWIDGYKLYTQAKGAEAIVVKIASLEENKMVLEMNRAGSAEEITFGRGTVNRINDPVIEDE